MRRRPIAARIEAGAGGPPPPGAELREAVREAFARWASGVAVVAVREEGDVVGLTATAFAPLSLDPPLVLVAVGVNAAVLPFLEVGARFAVSILAEGQRRVASLFADAAPLGRAAVAAEGDPVVEGALAALACTVQAVHPGGDHRIVVGAVERVVLGPAGSPLLYYDRDYRRLG